METKQEQKRIVVTAEAASLARDTIMSYIERNLPDEGEQMIAIINVCVILSAGVISSAIDVGVAKKEAVDIFIQLLKDNIEVLTKKD